MVFTRCHCRSAAVAANVRRNGDFYGPKLRPPADRPILIKIEACRAGIAAVESSHNLCIQGFVHPSLDIVKKNTNWPRVR